MTSQLSGPSPAQRPPKRVWEGAGTSLSLLSGPRTVPGVLGAPPMPFPAGALVDGGPETPPWHGSSVSTGSQPRALSISCHPACAGGPGLSCGPQGSQCSVAPSSTGPCPGCPLDTVFSPPEGPGCAWRKVRGAGCAWALALSLPCPSQLSVLTQLCLCAPIWGVGPLVLLPTAPVRDWGTALAPEES